MSWRAFRSAGGTARRLGPAPEGPVRQGTLLWSFDAAELSRARGPLLRVGPRLEPQRIFALDRRRDGDLSLLIRDGAEVSHVSIVPSDDGERVILAYLWRCGTDEALLSLLSGETRIARCQGRCPVPAISGDQIATLFTSRHGVFRHPAIRAMAFADHLVPAGPLHGLLAGSMVTTPDGPRSVETLRPGDAVLSPEGSPLPILWQGGTELPALPGLCPIRLKAPFHGLGHDLIAAPDQLIAVTGRDIEYQFGAERVLIRARDLLDGVTATEEPVRTATLSYHALRLERPAAFQASGAWVQSHDPGWFNAGGRLRHAGHGGRVLAAFEAAELRRMRAGRCAPFAV